MKLTNILKEILLNESKIPNILYHITPDRNVSSILKYGLDPSKSVQSHTGTGIYLSDDKYTAINYENMYDEDCTLLQIDGSVLESEYMLPDDYELQDYIEDNPDKVGEYDDWKQVPWELSLKWTNQIKYIAKIPPSAIKIIDKNI